MQENENKDKKTAEFEKLASEVKRFVDDLLNEVGPSDIGSDLYQKAQNLSTNKIILFAKYP